MISSPLPRVSPRGVPGVARMASRRGARTSPPPPAGQGAIPFVDEAGAAYALPMAPIEGAVPFVEDDATPLPGAEMEGAIAEMDGAVAFIDYV
jgi:hypothetical protein